MMTSVINSSLVRSSLAVRSSPTAIEITIVGKKIRMNRIFDMKIFAEECMNVSKSDRTIAQKFEMSTIKIPNILTCKSATSVKH